MEDSFPSSPLAYNVTDGNLNTAARLPEVRWPASPSVGQVPHTNLHPRADRVVAPAIPGLNFMIDLFECSSWQLIVICQPQDMCYLILLQPLLGIRKIPAVELFDFGQAMIDVGTIAAPDVFVICPTQQGGLPGEDR